VAGARPLLERALAIYETALGPGLRACRPIKTSGRAFPVISFGYLSIERSLNKVYGIDCRP
jgi:hypothetical protein